MTNVDELLSQLAAATKLAANSKATQAQRTQALADMASLGEEIAQGHATRSATFVNDAKAALAPLKTQPNSTLNNRRSRP